MTAAMTADGLIATASVRLGTAGIEGPRAEARMLLAHVLGTGRAATLSARVTPEQAAHFEDLVARRATHEPFAYITGHREFWSLDFAVGPGVLLPRPDTETLIEEAIRLVPDRAAPLRIGDLGAGSGAILIAALHEFPNAVGLGFEASPDAHAYARQNLARIAPDSGQILLADWDGAPAGYFDLVFSNPPYIPSAEIESLAPDVSRFEPRAALDGGTDGLDAYRNLARLLPRILKPGGHALLEIGVGQADSVAGLMRNLEILRIVPDLSGVPRCVILRKPQDSLGKPGSIG